MFMLDVKNKLMASTESFVQFVQIANSTWQYMTANKINSTLLKSAHSFMRAGHVQECPTYIILEFSGKFSQWQWQCIVFWLSMYFSEFKFKTALWENC